MHGCGTITPCACGIRHTPLPGSGAGEGFIYGLIYYQSEAYLMAGEMLKITTDVLERLLSANTIVGDAVDTGDKTFIPVAGFGFGFGSGEGEGTGKGKEGEGSGQGAGSGAGGGINPVAVIILHKDVKGLEGVQVISLRKNSGLAEIVGTVGEEVLPHVVVAMKEMVGKKAEKEGKEIPVTEEGGTE
jgi:uncharacterized spore protein YtfJ